MIRPSPVKEVPPSCSRSHDLFHDLSHDPENEDATSGSSIQILDEGHEEKDESLQAEIKSLKSGEDALTEKQMKTIQDQTVIEERITKNEYSESRAKEVQEAEKGVNVEEGTIKDKKGTTLVEKPAQEEKNISQTEKEKGVNVLDKGTALHGKGPSLQERVTSPREKGSLVQKDSPRLRHKSLDQYEGHRYGKALERCPATTDLLANRDPDLSADIHKLDSQVSLPVTPLGGSEVSLLGALGGAEDREKLHRMLSPLTVMGMDFEGKRGTRIRRAHSTASFERYKQVSVGKIIFDSLQANKDVLDHWIKNCTLTIINNILHM